MNKLAFIGGFMGSLTFWGCLYIYFLFKLKESFTSDPSSNVMNYVKFTAVMAVSIAVKQYLEDKKILPDSV